MALTWAQLAPLLRGWLWWGMGVATVVIILGGMAVIRWARLPRILLIPAALALLIGGLIALFGWDAVLGGGGDSVRARIADGFATIAGEGIPANVSPGLLFLMVAGIGLLAVLLDSVVHTLQAPAWAGLVFLAMAAVPVFFVPDGTGWLALVGAALGYLLLLFVTGGRPGRGPARHHTGPALTIAGASVVVAVALAELAPGFTSSTVIPGLANPLSLGQTITPLVDLGQDLRRPAASRVLTYQTDATARPYLTLFTLERFTGDTWSVAAGEGSASTDLTAIGPVPGLTQPVSTLTVSTDITIESLNSQWLPLPYPSVEVTGLQGQWQWENEGLTVFSTRSASERQQYSVTSLVVEPTREQLHAAGSDFPDEVHKDLLLPEDLPPIITDTAASVTQDAVDDYDRALLLQAYLRGPEFRYSTLAPIRDGYDGDGAEVIATFLNVKRGYCTHFASAMAIMARALGIPARVSVGYLPGTRIARSATGELSYAVSSHDLHAWPELYFPSVGWLPFEPTPGRGTLPAYARPESLAAQADARSAASGGAADRPAPPDPARALSGRSSAVPELDDVAPSTLTVLAATALALLLPAATRLVIRGIRRYALETGRGGIALGWREITDTAADHGIPASPMQTPRAFAGRLAELKQMDTSAVARLLARLERSRYAQTEQPGTRGRKTKADGVKNDVAKGNVAKDLAADVRLVRRGIVRSMPFRTRVRAHLMPRSVARPTRRWRPAR